MPTSKPAAIGAFTSLRGLAAWWVVLYHFHPTGLPAPLTAFVKQGYLAVDLFFVLSGFVIWLNYAPALAPPSWSATGNFLRARLARIWPLHAVMSALYLLVPASVLLFSAMGDPGPRFEPGYYVASLFLVHNWGWFDEIGWNVPSWSISTEWAAYLLFPLAPPVLLGLRSTLARLMAILFLLGGIALLFDATRTVSLGDDLPHLGLPRCLLEFAVGALLCRLYLEGRTGNRALLLAAVAGLTGAYAAGLAPDWAVMPAAFACLILALTTGHNQLLGGRVLAWLGEISYSTYLAHYFLKDWTKFLLVRPGIPEWLVFAAYLGATLIASALLHRWVEKPGQIWMRQLGRKRTNSVNAVPQAAG